MSLVQLGRNVLKQTIKNKKKMSTLCLLQFRGKVSLTLPAQRIHWGSLTLFWDLLTLLIQHCIKTLQLWSETWSRAGASWHSVKTVVKSAWTQHWKAFVSQMKRSWIIFIFFPFFLFFFIFINGTFLLNKKTPQFICRKKAWHVPPPGLFVW